MRDKDLGYKALKKRIEQLNDKDSFTTVGFLADNTKDGRDDGPTNLEVAVFNEFGTRDMPARPFMRTTFDTNEKAYEGLAGKMVDKVVRGELTVKQVLGLIGAKVSADIKNAITQGPGIPPPNSPVTVLKKGSSRPLIDSGQMADAITWQVGPSKEGGE